MEFFSSARLHLQQAVHRRQGRLHGDQRRGLRHAAERAVLPHVHQPRAGDTAHVTEGLFALSCNSRAEVDEMVRRPSTPAARTPRTRWITASCTAGASTTSTATTGKCCGWTRTRFNEGDDDGENHTASLVRHAGARGRRFLCLGFPQLPRQERDHARRHAVRLRRHRRRRDLRTGVHAPLRGTALQVQSVDLVPGRMRDERGSRRALSRASRTAARR